MHRATDLRALVEDADGERRSGSKTHPDAIIPDLSKAEPLVTFTDNDIAFVYGSKWKQRYLTKIGDDYFPLAAQCDVTHKQWLRSRLGTGEPPPQQ